MIESRLLIALIDAAWQGALVAAAAALLLRFVRTNAATRCAVWTAVLVILAALTPANLAPPAPAVSHIVPAPAPVAVRATSVVAVPRLDARAIPSALAAPQPIRVGVRADALRIVLGLLAAAALLRLALLSAGYVRLRRLVRHAQPLERALPLASRRSIRVVTTDAVEVPFAVGLGAATIVLPTALVATLSAEELDQVLVHEIAHLARRDDLTNLVERVVAAVLFFHPAVHVVSRRLDLEREIACDDWVVAATGSRRPYAFCLTKVAELALGTQRRTAPALGLFASRNVLRKRVEHLLDATASALPRRTRFAVIAVVGIAFLSLGIGAIRLPVVATPLVSPEPTATAAHTPVARPLPLRAIVAHKAQAPKPRPTPSQDPPSFVRRQIMVVRPAAPVRVVAAMPQVRTDIGIARAPLEATVAGAEVAQVEATASAPPAPVAPAPTVTMTIVLPRAIAIPHTLLQSPDYRGKDLRGHNFVASMLVNADFTGADLRGAHFDGSSLRNPKFSGARLSGASFVGSSISGCACAGVDFSGAQFVGVNFHNSDLSGASLARASLIGANFVGVKVANADFSNANLTGANFVRTDLTGANLRGANLEGINVVGARLHAPTP
ncbi:MAG: pentapeptide repeat-containing protein [Candidatus Eremiobacteraeota bacterium]|nr:pentapeptide repeat-containing protein [Candidatus Eremiobacteraeota bacterium]